jgi:hypothetical protein
MTSDALAKRATVADLVASYQRAEIVVRESFARIADAQAALDATFNLAGLGNVEITPRGEQHVSACFDADAAIARMKRDAWRFVVERLELRRVLSSARAKKLDGVLERDELPDLTEENVRAFAARYAADLPALLAESIAEVFEWMRPREGTRAARLKTNDAVEVGEKVVLVNYVGRAFGGGFVVRSEYVTQRLRALENVFSALDGDGQTGKRYRSLLEDAIEASKDGRGETKYFRFRACKNSNLHLEFRRPDLLARFNRVAGGARLRPAKTG